MRDELQAIADQANDRAATLRLAETLGAFLGRLRSSAQTRRLRDRQKIVRLLVKEVLVGSERIVIRHSTSPPLTPSARVASIRSVHTAGSA